MTASRPVDVRRSPGYIARRHGLPESAADGRRARQPGEALRGRRWIASIVRAPRAVDAVRSARSPYPSPSTSPSPRHLSDKVAHGASHRPFRPRMRGGGRARRRRHATTAGASRRVTDVARVGVAVAVEVRRARGRRCCGGEDRGVARGDAAPGAELAHRRAEADAHFCRRRPGARGRHESRRRVFVDEVPEQPAAGSPPAPWS